MVCPILSCVCSLVLLTIDCRNQNLSLAVINNISSVSPYVTLELRGSNILSGVNLSSSVHVLLSTGRSVSGVILNPSTKHWAPNVTRSRAVGGRHD